jgi:hypothetical protein
MLPADQCGGLVVVVTCALVVLVMGRVVVPEGNVVAGRPRGAVVLGPLGTRVTLGSVVVVAVPVPFGNDTKLLGEPINGPGNVATGLNVPV